MTRLASALALLLVAAAPARSWHDGVPVQMPESGIRIEAVRSNWQMDFEYAPPPVHPGPIYFDDCVTFVNTGAVGVRHLQIVFIGVDPSGIPRAKPLPLDLQYNGTAQAIKTPTGGCRDHVYPNGERGLWLVGYVNRVDYADGTSWKAPPLNRMQPFFAAALANLEIRGD